MKIKSKYSENEKIYQLYEELNQPQILKDIFYTNDLPVLFKGLKLYPASMRIYKVFYILANCLILRKNATGDINAIQMNYLDYLFYLAVEKQTGNYLAALIQLLYLVFHKDEVACDENGEELIVGGEKVKSILFNQNTDNKHWQLGILKDDIDTTAKDFGVNYIWIDGNDFDEFRRIICEQNEIEVLPDDIHPDKVRKIEEYEAYLARTNRNKICSLEEQISILTIVGGLKKEDILDMSIRSFNDAIKRLGTLIEYVVSRILSPYMDAKDQKKIKSWIGDLEKIDRLARIEKDYKSFNEKMTNTTPNNKELL